MCWVTSKRSGQALSGMRKDMSSEVTITPELFFAFTAGVRFYMSMSELVSLEITTLVECLLT